MKVLRINKLWAALLAVVLALVIGSCAVVASTQASAEENVDPYAPGACWLQKNVEASEYSTFSATVNYGFTKVSVNDDTSPDAQATMPDIKPGNITVSANSGSVGTGVTKTAVAGKTGVWNYSYKKDFTFLGVDSALAENKFAHAGEYVYTVQESIVGDLTPSAGWTNLPDPTKTIYTVRFYVKNDTSVASGLSILGVTITSDETTKVDTLQTTSYLSEKKDLTIKKEVAGDYADKTKEFDFALTLYHENFSTTPAPTILAAVIDTDGTTAISKVTGTVDTTSKTATFSFKLKHDQKLVFDGKDHTITTPSGTDTFKASNLEVGTTYRYVETGVTNYKVSATTTCKIASGDRTVPFADGAFINAGKGIDLSYDVNSTSSTITPTDPNNPEVTTYAAAVGNNSGNISTIKNTYIDVTPTSFLLDNAPYILLIGIPILACVLYVVIRSRRRNN